MRLPRFFTRYCSFLFFPKEFFWRSFPSSNSGTPPSSGRFFILNVSSLWALPLPLFQVFLWLERGIIFPPPFDPLFFFQTLSFSSLAQSPPFFVFIPSEAAEGGNFLSTSYFFFPPPFVGVVEEFLFKFAHISIYFTQLVRAFTSFPCGNSPQAFPFLFCNTPPQLCSF